MGPRRLLTGGIAYVLGYALVTALLPRPSSPSVTTLIAILAIFLPTALAIVVTAQAARGSGTTERSFWVLLCAAAVAHAANQIVYAIHALGFPEVAALRLAGHMGYYTYFILLFVALLARPDRVRPSREGGAAALDSMIAVATGYFLLFYFVLLSYRDTRYPWFVVFTVQELGPGLLALGLARGVRDAPFRQVYGLIAFGLVAGSAVSLWPNWRYIPGGSTFYSPFDVSWMLPLIGIAAAARCPRSPVWVRSVSESGKRHRPRLVLFAMAFPPLLDLATRASGLQPHLANERSQVALVSAAALSILAAFRLRRSAAPAPPPGRPADSPEVRTALGQPTELMQFASGVAHEINNPLMAVAGWAELALRRGAPAAPLQALIASARSAAEAVVRLQRVASATRRGDPR